MSANARSEGAGARLTVMLEVRSLDRGGMETVVALLATGLGSLGIDPVVVCTEAGGRGVDELRAAGIRVEVLGGQDRGGQMAALLDRLEVAVLNAHYSSLGVRLAAERRIPVVVTLHNSYAWFGPGALDEIGAIDPYVSAYVAVSHSAAAFTARRFHVATERIRVVRNGIRASRRPRESELEARAALCAELGLPADAELVVQVGRIERVKGQLALVDAVARLHALRPRLVALIAGADGEPEYAATVRARVESEGLSSVVRVLGERGDVARILAAASVATMPSFLEGLSLAAVEALRAGVPIVLTRTGDADALLGEGDPRYADALPGALIDAPALDLATADWADVWARAGAEHPSHAVALAEALAAVLDDLPRRRAAAARRGADLEHELSAERMCRETAQVLTDVVLAASVATRFELAVARRLVAEERARNDDLRVAVDELASAVASQVRNQAAAVARVEHQLATVEATTSRTLDKLRIKHRVEAGVAAVLGRFTGRPAAASSATALRSGAAGAAGAGEQRAADGMPARRPRARRWLVLAPHGAGFGATGSRPRRLAAELAAAGELVTLAGAEAGTVTAQMGTAHSIEILPPGLDAFERWMERRDESLRVLLATTHPSALEIARRARERGARILCDVGQATDAGEPVAGWIAEAAALSDDVVVSSSAAALQVGSAARALHVLPDGVPAASALVALVAPPTVAVVVLCHNNADIIESCVESLVENRGRLNYQIAIVDNCSSDGSWEWLAERGKRGDVIVQRNERNGCSSGRNLGVRVTHGEIVVFLDSDQRALHPGWLDPALEILRSNAAIGAVGWNAGWFRPGSGGGTIVDDLPDRGMSGAHAGACFRTDIAFLATSGFAAPRSLLARTAGFDEFFDPTCFEDTDISFQIKDLGYELAYCPHLAIDHRPHATTGALQEYSALYKRNEEYFLTKWQRRPEFFFDVR